MKQLIIFFVLLLIAIALGMLMQQDSGYVMISMGHWSIETSVWAGAAVIVVLFVAFYAILRFISHTRRLPSRIKAWQAEKKSSQSFALAEHGFHEFAQGNWGKAEKHLSTSAKHAQTPLINYIAAARAAHAQQAFERRDEYLREAANVDDKNTRLAAGITQAQLQISSEQWERALATLQQLNKLSPHHAQILKLMAHVYAEAENWAYLRTLIPEMRKYKVLGIHELDRMEKQIYLALLAEAARATDHSKLEEVWNTIPKDWRYQPEIVAAFTRALIHRQEFDKAIPHIETGLKKSWDKELLHNYSLAKGADPLRQISTAERWLKQYPNDAHLLLCLAELCKRAEVWGKAREYFEQSLSIQPQSYGYQQLGELLEILGDKNAAIESYRKGLALKNQLLGR